jgi:hypothetical protein
MAVATVGVLGISAPSLVRIQAARVYIVKVDCINVLCSQWLPPISG